MKGEKTILRQHRRDHFVQVPNETVRDSCLSWKATGLLCFLLSLPDRWEVNLAHLSSTKKDGRDATRAGMRELEATGYLRKDVLRDGGGRIEGTQWIVSDFPFPGNPNTDSPKLEKPPQRIQTTRKKKLRTPQPPVGELLEAAIWEASCSGRSIGAGWKKTVLARLEKGHDEDDVNIWTAWKRHHDQLAERAAQQAAARQAPELDPQALAKGRAFIAATRQKTRDTGKDYASQAQAAAAAAGKGSG